jgi:hypothetical protein
VPHGGDDVRGDKAVCGDTFWCCRGQLTSSHMEVDPAWFRSARQLAPKEREPRRAVPAITRRAVAPRQQKPEPILLISRPGSASIAYLSGAATARCSAHPNASWRLQATPASFQRHVGCVESCERETPHLRSRCVIGVWSSRRRVADRLRIPGAHTARQTWPTYFERLDHWLRGRRRARRLLVSSGWAAGLSRNRQRQLHEPGDPKEPGHAYWKPRCTRFGRVDPLRADLRRRLGRGGRI